MKLKDELIIIPMNYIIYIVLYFIIGRKCFLKAFEITNSLIILYCSSSDVLLKIYLLFYL